MAASRINLFSVEIPKEYAPTQISDMLIAQNDDISRFVIDDCDATNLDGYYISKVKKNETIFNYVSGQFESTIIERSVCLKFNIDALFGRMICIGNLSIVNQMLTSLSVSLHNRIVIEAYPIDLSRFIADAAFVKNIKMKKAKIDEMVLGNGILANCSIEFARYDDAMELLLQHKDNVSQVSFSMPVSDEYDIEELSCTLYKTGSLIVRTNITSFSDPLKSVIYRLYLDGRK